MEKYTGRIVHHGCWDEARWIGHECSFAPVQNNDDYYEFWKGFTAWSRKWTNQDQAPVGSPRIWAGVLKPDESARFLVTLQEQDNKDFGSIKKALDSFFDDEKVKFAAGLIPWGEKARERGKKLSKYLPTNTKDDIIGAFYVEVENQDGKLFTSWIATEIEFEEGGEFATTKINDSDEIFVGDDNRVSLEFDGTRGALYSGYARARTYSRLPTSVRQAKRYLGRSHDRCSSSAVRLNNVRILKGQTKEVRGRFGSRLKWKCGSSNEQTVSVPKGTDLIVARRAVSGRKITWYFFNEESY